MVRVWALSSLLLVVSVAHGQDAPDAVEEEPDASRAGETEDGAPGEVVAPGERARELWQRGIDLAAEERWGEALEYFRRSRELMERPSTVLNIAACLERLGRLNEAVDAFQTFLRISDPEAEAAFRAGAEQTLERVRQRISHLELSLDPADATVAVDGSPTEGDTSPRYLSLDPGGRNIRVSHDGYAETSFRVALLPGARESRDVTLEPLPEPETVVRVERQIRPTDPAPWIVFGAGAAVAISGGVMIGAAQVDADRVENPPAGSTWGDIEEAYDRALALRITGPALLGVGVAAMVAGITWHFVIDGYDNEHAIAILGIGPTEVSWRVDF